MSQFVFGDWFLLPHIPNAQRAVVVAREKRFLVDELHAIDTARVTVVDKL